MRKFTFFLSFAGLVMLFACKNDSAQSGSTAAAKSAPKVPPSMEFKNQTQKPGPKPQVGQYVYYDMLVTCNDVIIKSTYNGAGYAKAKFVDVSGEDASPSMIALKSMSVGDSTTILVKGDKYIEQLKKTFYPDAFGDVKYQIVLRAIKSEKEYLQDLELTRKGMQKRLEGAIPKNNNREVIR